MGRKSKSKGGGGASSGGKSVPKPPKPKDRSTPDGVRSGNSGESRPFYQILGVEVGASLEEIRKSYNRMAFFAKKYFISTKALESVIYTLGDEERRREYDFSGFAEEAADSNDEDVKHLKKLISLSLNGEAFDAQMITNEVDYRGSDAEIYDICGLYRKHKGDMYRILSLVLFYDKGATWCYKYIVDDSINSGKLETTRAYEVWASDVVKNHPQTNPSVNWDREKQKVLKCNRKVEVKIMQKALDEYSLEPFVYLWKGTLNCCGFQDTPCHVILLYRSDITDKYVDALMECSDKNILKVINCSVTGSLVALACEPLYCTFSSFIDHWNESLTTVRQQGCIVDYTDKCIRLMRKILKSVNKIHSKGYFLTRLDWTDDIYMTYDGEIRLSLTGWLCDSCSGGSVEGDIALVAKVFENMINVCFPDKHKKDMPYWTEEMRTMVQLMNNNYYKTPLECLRNPVVMYSSKKVSALIRFGDSSIKYVEKDIPSLWRKAIWFSPEGPRDCHLKSSSDKSENYGEYGGNQVLHLDDVHPQTSQPKLFLGGDKHMALRNLLWHHPPMLREMIEFAVGEGRSDEILGTTEKKIDLSCL